MESERIYGRAGHGETQMDAIRDLMTRAAAHGEWLTLGEISQHTQFGEASISAQLRHLRKPKHGHYCVAKRIRTQMFPHEPADATAETDHVGILWEYRIVSRAAHVASGLSAESRELGAV